MKIAKFQYKCRLCGEIYNACEMSESIASTVLINAITGDVLPALIVGTQPRMIEIHATCKAGKGIADLIGYIVEDD